MLVRFLKWFDTLPHGVRLFIAAVATAVPLYSAGLIEQSAVDAFKLEDAYATGARAVIVIFLIASVAFVYMWVGSVRASLQARDRTRLEMRLQAYTQVDRVLSEEIADVDVKSTEADLVRFAGASVEDLRRIVQAAYSTFESTFGLAAKAEERIDFEVTFMTRSYRDSYITIPAAANRDGRAPRSMVLREKRPDIYEGSITAAVYREEKPAVRIVEDTSDKATYQELYPTQKERIRSSIVFPVLSDQNELLGTLVVHCDRKDFFLKTDEKFWSDVLEIFAKRLALAKKRLDACLEKHEPAWLKLPAAEPF